jgi:hypothetical protein
MDEIILLNRNEPGVASDLESFEYAPADQGNGEDCPWLLQPPSPAEIVADSEELLASLFEPESGGSLNTAADGDAPPRTAILRAEDQVTALRRPRRASKSRGNRRRVEKIREGRSHRRHVFQCRQQLPGGARRTVGTKRRRKRGHC